MAWRVATSLLVLRDQLNAMYPDRSKLSDGFIGDAAHQAEGSASDHNPWLVDGSGVGVVTAFDITHDPDHGLDIAELAQELTTSRDQRIKYVIANRQIMEPAGSGWSWYAYNGDDPHTNHLHLSVNTSNYDDSQQWKLKGEPMPNEGDVINVYQDINHVKPSATDIQVYTSKPWGAPDGLYYGKIMVDIRNKDKDIQNKQQQINKLLADKDVGAQAKLDAIKKIIN